MSSPCDVEHVVIGYHYPCADGAFAALAAWLFYESSKLGQVRSGGNKGISSFSSSSTVLTKQTSVSFLPLTVWSTENDRIETVNSILLNLGDGVVCSTFYLLDFSGGVSFLRRVSELVKRVYVIDHHKTAQEDIEAMESSDAGKPANLKAIFDMNKSGATLALSHFFPNAASVEQAIRSVAQTSIRNTVTPIVARSSDKTLSVEEVVERTTKNFAYVEDNDLWNHVLPDSLAFSAGLACAKMEYDPNKNAAMMETLLCGVNTEDVIKSGKLKLQEDEEKMKKELDERLLTLSISYVDESNSEHIAKFFAVQTQHPELRSKLGHKLASISESKGGFDAIGGVVYSEPGMGEGKIKVSLRSLGEVDTTKISRSFGGGGHQNASSFITSASKLDAWVAMD